MLNDTKIRFLVKLLAYRGHGILYVPIFEELMYIGFDHFQQLSQISNFIGRRIFVLVLDKKKKVLSPPP